MRATRIERDELKERLERLHEAAEGGRQHGHQRGAVRWFAEHPLVDLTPRQVYNYLHGATIPDRIIAVLETLEREHGVADE